MQNYFSCLTEFPLLWLGDASPKDIDTAMYMAFFALLIANFMQLYCVCNCSNPSASSNLVTIGKKK